MLQMYLGGGGDIAFYPKTKGLEFSIKIHWKAQKSVLQRKCNHDFKRLLNIIVYRNVLIIVHIFKLRNLTNDNGFNSVS